MKVEVLVRQSFREVPGLTARRIAGNAWEILVPKDEATQKLTRRGPRPEDWDGAIFFLDGQETMPATGTGENKLVVKVTALVL